MKKILCTLMILISTSLMAESQKKKENLWDNLTAPAKKEESKLRFPKPFTKLAIVTIKDYPEVKDATINQDKEQISLVVIVRRSVGKEKAKEMGDNFLRLLMANSMGTENSPKKEIGPTKYSYLIGVYYPDDSEVALGAKAPAARRITW
ncbi:MAG: hypothetical protein ACPGJV_02110 [Bacteriovoracaceae bacterium]